MNTNPQPRERLHGLDAVRGFALLLGVVLHACMSYLPGPQVWIVADSSHTEFASAVFYVLHMFRMVLFFVLAGFFAHGSFHRLGVKGFMVDRLKRIGGPLVVFWPLVITAITAILLWNVWLANGGRFPEQSQPSPPLSLDYFPLAHLWFLYVLVLLYAITLSVRGLLEVIKARIWLSDIADGLVRVVIGWGGIVLIVVPVTLGLYLHPNWLMWFGVPTPDMSLKPSLAALVAYGTAFGFGWLLQRQPNLLALLERRAWVYLALAVVCTVSSLSIAGSVVPVLTPAPANTTTLLYAALYSLGAWGWSFALIGLALRFLSSFNATRRYIAEASYWVYIQHLPLVMLFQTLASRLEWPWFIELPLVIAATLLVAFSSYHWLVRFSFIGAALNGRRAQRAPQAATAQHGTAA